MAANRNDEIANKATNVISRPCSWGTGSHVDAEHIDCTALTYHVAELFYGSKKTHRMSYTLHTGDGKMYSGSGPACGSKTRGQLHRGTLGGEVTCGRC